MITTNPMDVQNQIKFFTQLRSPILPWNDLMDRYYPISLAQMDGAALLDRTDTKYVMGERQLFSALSSLTGQYQILDIHGIRLNHYRTLYFDTANFALYLRHHADARNRYKVRSRKYVDTDLSFFEVKHKVNKNRTIKKRIPTPEMATQFMPETSDFVSTHSPLNPHILEPKLWNDFSRITLVSKHRPERLTLDITLQFCGGSRTVTLPGIAIAEVKQDGIDHDSDFIRQMRAMNIRSTGFSKYCMGVSMLYQQIKHNNFKPKLRLVNKLMRGYDHVQRTH